ncbi:MAG: hypothetical protein GXY76_01450 [Chloroflexi bacterium]|nr:hypothetical protein [Chloroflexota bacterium]
MKNMSVSWTDAVEALEVHFALDAVIKVAGRLQETGFHRGWLQAAPVINAFGDWEIPSLPADAPYRSYRWYVDQSLDAQRGTVNGAKLAETILNEPWQRQNPHYDLSLIGQPLDVAQGDAVGEEALALLVPGRVAVVSVAPLRRIRDERVRLFAVRRTVAHQVGHLFGLPQPGRPHALPSPSGERHCANLCVLSEAHSLDELVEMTMRELSANILLCDDCWQDLLRVMMDSHLGVN